MANYTEHYQLHQWEPEDSFLRTDFNQDFSRIDTALASLAGNLDATDKKMPKVTVGSYKGNSSPTEPQTITLPFKPIVVLIWCNHYSNSRDSIGYYNGMATEGQPLGNGILTLSDNGFTVKSTKDVDYQAYPYLNANYTYFYLAVG